jgi:hypothetical protein
MSKQAQRNIFQKKIIFADDLSTKSGNILMGVMNNYVSVNKVRRDKYCAKWLKSIPYEFGLYN